MFILSLLIIGMSVPYYNDPRIHNMGNTGNMGKIHALLAPVFTKGIDMVAYKSVDVRKHIYSTFEGDVIDLCCGTGFSTKPSHTGIDTSPEMINMAKLYNKNSNYIVANAETFGTRNSYDIVSCMFAFHEMPNEAHINIINNAIKIARKRVVIVDISTNYKPSNIMLTGEPFILDYLKNINTILDDFTKTELIKNHVDSWELII